MLAIRRVGGYVGKDKGSLILSVILIIFQTASMAMNPYIIGLAVTELTKNVMAMAKGVAGAGINFPYIKKVIILMLIFGAIVEVAAFFSNYLMTGVVQRTMLRLRCDLAKKINRLPMSFFDQHLQGDLLSRVTNDVDSISTAMQQCFLQLISSTLNILFSIVMMFVISFAIGWVGVLLIPLSILAIRFWVGKSQNSFQDLQDALGDMTSIVQETYEGFAVVKLYDKEEDYETLFEQTNDRLAKAAKKGNTLAGFSNPTVGALVNIAYISIIVFGSSFVFAGKMTVGNLQATSQYVWQIFSPLSQIAQLMPPLQIAIASTVRVFSILDEPEERVETETIRLPEHVKGAVSFEDVRFGYTPNKMVIDGFSLDVEPGKTVAIVGPTGVGKTTIANLLERFYELDSGHIRIDGIDTAEMTRTQLRSLIGVVPQDPWLFHGTIEENLRFGKLDADYEEIVDAAYSANVDGYIRRLDHGYESMINSEASNISQGQKQLMTIARAILEDPPILILDEATSSIDTRLELLIQETMNEVMKGRTSFVIAHRLSTIRDADIILVMREGNIAEQGRHEELLAQGGYYADLYNSQFGGAMVE